MMQEDGVSIFPSPTPGAQLLGIEKTWKPII